MGRMRERLRFLFGGRSYKPNLLSFEIAAALLVGGLLAAWAWALLRSSDSFGFWSSVPGGRATWPWVTGIVIVGLVLLEANRRMRQHAYLRLATHAFQWTAALVAVILGTTGVVVAVRGDARTGADLLLISASAALAAVLPYQHLTMLEKVAGKNTDRR